MLCSNKQGIKLTTITWQILYFSFRNKDSALEELFRGQRAEETPHSTTTTYYTEKMKSEVSVYRALPHIPMYEDPVFWWWDKKDTLTVCSDFLTSVRKCVLDSQGHSL